MATASSIAAQGAAAAILGCSLPLDRFTVRAQRPTVIGAACLLCAVGDLRGSGEHCEQASDRKDELPAFIRELIMDENAFNTSIRKFLKSLGVTAQREIEKAVRQALAEHRLKGDETLPAKANVSIGQLNFTFEIDGQIELE
jgi:hypothetical protein